MTDEEAIKQCQHKWKNISSKRQIVYQCEHCGIYTFDPPEKSWVGLTDDERGQVYAGWRFNGSNSSNLELCRAIEAKLKEKNNG